MDMRIRPQSDYLQQAEWKELYILTRHWQSDMEFYSDELKFLHNLVSKYFIWMIKDESIDRVQKLTNKLQSEDREKKEVGDKIELHILQLEDLIKGTFTEDEQLFREEHAGLEDRFTAFVKSFKLLKKEAFSITEHVMESEKFKHLLTT